jgi:hypothetical protein
MANNTWRPDVSDKDSAEKAIVNGFGAAAFVASVTTIIALISIFLHKPILGIDCWGLFDAMIFAAIAFGIYKKSRASPVAGLVVYVIERVYMMSTNGAPTSGVIMTFILTMSFVHGIRGTFAYSKFNRQVVANAPVPSGE